MDKVMKMDDPMKDTMFVLIDTVDQLKMDPEHLMKIIEKI